MTLEIDAAESVYVKDGPLSGLHPLQLSLGNVQDRDDRIQAADSEYILVLKDHVADLDLPFGYNAADRGP